MSTGSGLLGEMLESHSHGVYITPTGQQLAMNQRLRNAIADSMHPQKITTMSIEEASNGLIVRLGSNTRICTDAKNLAETIAAVYAEERMK